MQWVRQVTTERDTLYITFEMTLKGYNIIVIIAAHNVDLSTPFFLAAVGLHNQTIQSIKGESN